MKTVEFIEIPENFSLDGNNADAILDMKLKNSKVNTTSLRLVKDKKTKTYYLIIEQYNGKNYFIPCKDLEEASKLSDLIIANLDYSKRINYNETMYLEGDLEDFDIGAFRNATSDAERSINDTNGIIITDVNRIRISGSKLKTINEIAPILLDKVTNKDNAIDFSLSDYSLITTFLLFNEIVEPVELTKEDILFINQYKRNEGLESRISHILRKKNFYYTDNLDMYVNVLRKWEEIFRKAPKLKRDVIIYRGGEGTNRNNAQGSTNLYDGLVSFSLSDTYAEWFAHKFNNRLNGTVYKMKLSKGMPCLSLFSSSDIEGKYIEEVEILLPSFIYHVDSKYTNLSHKLTNLNISFMGTIPMMDLLYEKINRSLVFPPVLSEDGEIIDLTSDDNMSAYMEKGYNPNNVVGHRQISVLEAVNYMSDENIIEDMYKVIKEIHAEELNYESFTHGFMHIQRVYFMATLMAQIDGLSEEDKRVLLTAVRFHDIGRVNDLEDREHGENSTKKLKAHMDRLDGFTEEEKEIIFFAISQHSKSALDNDAAVLGLPPEKRERYKRILNYLKDADKLDRVRLGVYETTDVNRLSLDTSKKLVLLSYCLEKYHYEIIDYLWTVVNYNMRKTEHELLLEEVDKYRTSNKNHHLMDIANKILDGETIDDGNISLESIFRVTKNIMMDGARSYLASILEPLRRMVGEFKHGR